MPIEILMPALSPTMEEGKLARWLVKEGDAVSAGTVIAEIETDKATMEVEAIDDGTVGKLLVAEGAEGVKINTPIAVLLEDGEDAGDIASAPAPAVAPAAATAAPAAQPPASAAPARPAPAAPAPPPAPAAAAPPPATGGGAPGAAPERVRSSPLARRLAKSNGIDITRISGSGPRGRVIKADIEAALQTGAGRASATGTALAPAPTATGPVAVAAVSAMPDDQVLALYESDTFELVPHDGMRKIIATRLTQSKQTIPHFYLTLECELDELLRARKRINEAAPQDGPRAYKLSVNDFIIKALALALKDVPAANATWTDGGMLVHRHCDVGVAVAVEGGLFTPVIRHAELKTLGEISNEMKDLAGRARKRRLAPHEYQGGTTSISNLGMYGIKAFDAVINPPHATILAVGAGEQRPVVANGELKIATVMSCTLSCDHRVVDGALGAELLNAFKRFIEDPVRMLV